MKTRFLKELLIAPGMVLVAMACPRENLLLAMAGAVWIDIASHLLAGRKT